MVGSIYPATGLYSATLEMSTVAVIARGRYSFHASLFNG